MARGEKVGPEPLEQAFRLPLFLGWQGRLNRHGWLFLASGRRRWLRGGELLDSGFLDAYRLSGAPQFHMSLLDLTRQLIAGLIGGQPFRILGANPLDLVVRGLEVLVGQQQDLRPWRFSMSRMARRFSLSRKVATPTGSWATMRSVFSFIASSSRMRRMERASDSTPRMVPWPLQRGHTLLAGFAQRGAQALAGHLQQAEARDARHLDAGAVLLQGIAQPVFHLALVLAAGSCR